MPPNTFSLFHLLPGIFWFPAQTCLLQCGCLSIRGTLHMQLELARIVCNLQIAVLSPAGVGVGLLQVLGAPEGHGLPLGPPSDPPPQPLWVCKLGKRGYTWKYIRHPSVDVLPGCDLISSVICARPFIF